MPSDHSCRAGRIRVVSLDVTGTLIHCPRLGTIYSEVLRRHGVETDAAEVESVFPLVWKEFDCSVVYGTERFSSQADGAPAWWCRFLERLCVLLGARSPSRFAASELFHRFAGGKAWEVYPEVRSALAELVAAGVRLAVVSNWDERLPDLLADLDLGVEFESVVYSGRVGVEKPHPRIFDTLVEELSVERDAVLHVGDRVVHDVEGANAAGIEAVLVRRGEAPESSQLADLAGLSGFLAGFVGEERSARQLTLD